MQVILTEQEYNELLESKRPEFNAELEAWKSKCEIQSLNIIKLNTEIQELGMRILTLQAPTKKSIFGKIFGK